MSIRKMLPIALTITIGFSMSAPALVRGATNAFGSPMYVGSTDLPVSVDFIEAGGGPGSFSMVRAYDNMIGPTALQDDLTELAAAYGQRSTDRFVRIFNFAVSDAWKYFGMDNLAVPEPTGNGGRSLALAMFHAGVAPDGTFWTGYLLGHVLTPRVYSQVTADIDNRFGPDADAQFHAMSNQLFNAVARQIGATSLGT
jgi:hypothetical protein